MSKVKVSKELFDALEKNKERYGSNFPHDFIFDLSIGHDIERKDFLTKRISYKEVIEAAVKGYELELTPHEIIKKHFDDNVITSSGIDGNAFFSSGFLQGVLLTLEALGEKVEGVNK